jgi:hypothetical protein
MLGTTNVPSPDQDFGEQDGNVYTLDFTVSF